jgi:hypothetical protein
MPRTYSAFYQDDQSAIVYRRKPNDGGLETLPRGAKPVEHPSSTYFRTDGGDKYEFAFFATEDGDLIVVQADGVAPNFL